MRFQYPLQKIVDLKGSEKSMAEWEYAAALGKLRQEEEKMADLVREQRELEQTLEQTALRPTPLTRINALQQYLEVLGERIKLQREDVRSAAFEAEYRQSRLADRMIDEKVWLNARDRAHERFKFEWLSKEQNELDEIAIVRAAAASRLA
ncbi:flagellar export protein FliJ [Cohnella sp. GCM10027633]|uniref:flagellar export protein FliJ n=1 Tax=unclassified Cohnella TaxID=2636738 RepID=UPI00363563CD